MTAVEPPPSLRATLLNPAGRPHMGSMIMTHGEAASRMVGEAAEMLADALADRFERLEAGRALRGMDADAACGAMVDRDEYCREALAGDRHRQVGSPHRVHHFRNDGAVMAARAAWRNMRREFVQFHVSTKSSLTAEGTGRVATLYAIEAEIRGHPAEHRRQVRQE